MRLNWMYFTDFVYWMQRNGYYERFIANVKANGADVIKLYNITAKRNLRIQTMLTRAFDWEQTIEGYRFWKRVHDELTGAFLDRPVHTTTNTLDYHDKVVTL